MKLPALLTLATSLEAATITLTTPAANVQASGYNYTLPATSIQVEVPANIGFVEVAQIPLGVSLPLFDLQGGSPRVDPWLGRVSTDNGAYFAPLYLMSNSAAGVDQQGRPILWATEPYHSIFILWTEPTTLTDPLTVIADGAFYELRYRLQSLRLRGTIGESVNTSVSLQVELISDEPAHHPEPASLLLVIGGLVLLWRRHA